MSVTELTQKKLWIVTGKGGVGKTTLSASLGMMAANQGLKTLMVETHGLSHLGDLMGVGEVGYSPQRIQPNLYLMQITPEKCLEEYLLHQVKFKLIYNTVFKNKYVRNFIDAAPGLIELLTIGKIWAMVDEKGRWGRKENFDLVIVDAPSTGHGISLLTVPEVVVNAVRVGPLHNKSKEILDLLRDQDRCLIWLATLPEEMPVNEAVETFDKLKNQVKVGVGPLLVNGLWPDILSQTSQMEFQEKKIKSPLLDVYERRLQLSQFYLGKIKDSFPDHPRVELPLVYQDTSPLGVAGILSDRLRDFL